MQAAVAVMSDVRRCAHIHSELQVGTEFHLFDGPCLESASAGSRTKPQNSSTEFSVHHFPLHHLRLGIGN